ncbi:MAG: leucine-rich repeat protein [Treponema sp.]|nr:leucine-rich repeat protein [Treponema sp.]
MRKFHKVSISVSHEGDENSEFSVLKVEVSSGKNSVEISDFETALSMLPPGSEVSVTARGTVGNKTVHKLSEIIRESPVRVHLDLSEVQELSRVYDTPFKGNHNLIGIVFPGNLISINEQAFAECKNLEKVSIPATVQKIGKQAFSGCEKMNFLEFKNTEDWFLIKDDNDSVRIANLEKAEDNPYRFTLPSSPYRNFEIRKMR